jgi:hypothetical protein
MRLMRPETMRPGSRTSTAGTISFVGGALPPPTEIETWLRLVARPSAPEWVEPAPPMVPGTRLGGGRFVVGAQLGRGGMGMVFEVRDNARGATLALKTLLDTRPERLLAFKREFRSLRGMTHRNLVRLDDLFESDGRWFFTMERVRGVPFTSFVRPVGLDPRRLRRALAELARGLLVLHEMGKVHHDVKPSNTLVEADGRVVLLDFGLVQDASASAGGHCGGTAAYMAPERAIDGDGPAAGGPSADWYGVGVMLHEALTGALPYPAPFDRRTAHDAGRPRRSPLLADGIPPDLAQLCLDLMNAEPERRPDGDEVLRRLEARRAFPPGAPAARAGTRGGPGGPRELTFLHRALARSRERAVIVLISGAAAPRKAALLDAFLDQLAAPVQILISRCYEHEFMPWKALDGLVDALVQHLDRFEDASLAELLPATAPTVARVFSVFRRVCRRAGLPFAAAASEPSAETRETAVAALGALLGRLGQRAPLVLVVDDLHWAGVDSLASLVDLLSSPDLRNVLAILTTRAAAVA